MIKTSTLLILLLVLLFAFLILNSSFHLFVKEGMENHGNKQVVKAKKNKKAVKDVNRYI